MQLTSSAQARTALDRRFSEADVGPIRATPRGGWLRAVRDALGMTQRQLASRLSVTGAAVAKFEDSERQGTITLGTLSKVAEAMQCTLVYAIVPSNSLKEIVFARAREIADADLSYVSTTMSLERQSVERQRLSDMQDERVQALLAAGKLWQSEPKP